MSAQDDIVVTYGRREIDVAGHEVESIKDMIEPAPDLGHNH
jgi:hypothetical protein